MSEHQQYLGEKEKIDSLIQKGYRIHSVKENLDGGFVEFYHPDQQLTETVHVETANARKYFSSLLILQNQT